MHECARSSTHARRSILLQLLRRRIKKVPRKVRVRIETTTSVQELEIWLKHFAEAQSLAEVGIPLD
jgi:ribosomal protein L31E